MLPMARSIWGRSFASRPYALVRSFGIPSEVEAGRRRGRDGADLRARGRRPARGLQP